MSSTDAAYLNYVSKQLYLYVGSFFYVSGLISNVLCILMFLSMKRLQNNPSSTYLLVSSIGNFVLFNTSYLSRLFLPNFILDPSSTSLVWCKLRQYFGHWSSTASLFCTAWAMMDQYLSTSANVYLRQFSTVKIARRIVFVTSFLSFFHSLPIVIYNEINVSKSTNISSCSLASNPVYQSYVAYFVTPFVLGIIPTFIMVVFAILTYTNINYLHQQQMRTQIQQQLTQMVSAQAIFVLLGMIAYTTQTIYSLLTASTPKSTLRQAQESVGLAISGILAYIGYAFNFYIYMIVSPSLRKQFNKLIKKHIRCVNHNNPNTIVTNRIAPVIVEARNTAKNISQPRSIPMTISQQLVPIET